MLSRGTCSEFAESMIQRGLGHDSHRDCWYFLKWPPMTAWCRKETFPGISPPSSASVAHCLASPSFSYYWKFKCGSPGPLSVLSHGSYLICPLRGSGVAPQTKPISQGLCLQLWEVPYFTLVLEPSVIQKLSFSFQSLLRAESSRAALSLVLHPPSWVLLKDSREAPMSSRRRPSSSEATLGMISTPSKHSGLLSGEKGQLYWSETRESCLETRGTTIDKQRKIPSTGEVMGSEAIAKEGTTRTL